MNVTKIAVEDVMTLIIILVILFLFCLLLARNNDAYNKLRNRVLIPLTAIAGFIIYYIGYQDGGTENVITTSCIRSFLSMCSMFLLHSDLLEVSHHMHGSKTYMLIFSIIHFSAFIISTLFIIQLCGKQFISWLSLKVSCPKQSYLFFDLNEATVSLAEDLMKKKKDRLVVFVGKYIRYSFFLHHKAVEENGSLCDNKLLFEQIKNTSAVFLNREYIVKRSLKKLGIANLIHKSESHLFFLSEDETLNIQMAQQVIEEIERESLVVKKLFIYINTVSENLDNLFTRKLSFMHKEIEIKVINRYKLSATELVDLYPPVDYIEKDTTTATALSDFNVLILGFGQIGTFALRYLIEQGQFVCSTFHATVIDHMIECKEDLFINKYPGVKSYQVEYEKAEVNSKKYFELLKNKIDSLKYVVVSLGDDRLNIKVAVELYEFSLRHAKAPVDLFVNVYNIKNYDYIKKTICIADKIHLFGGHNEIFREDIIVNEICSHTAKKIHEHYNKDKAEIDKEKWQELSMIKKMTNLSAAVHIYTKLKLAGLTVADVNKLEIKKDFEKLLGPERMACLAEGEHLHWNATLFTNGWETWNLSEINDDQSCNKDEIRKKHACLVSWDELEKVSKYFREDYKLYDMYNVGNIFELIKEGIVIEKSKNSQSD